MNIGQSKNTIILIGRVGSIKQNSFSVDGGTRAVSNLSIATTELGAKKENGYHEEKTAWHNVSAFGGLSDKINKAGIKVGSLVHIEGHLTYRQETKVVDGVTHVYNNAVIVADDIMNLTKKEAEQQAA